MSLVPTPGEHTRLTVVALRGALRQARPLPADEDLVTEGLTSEEWKAFEQALVER